MSAFPSVRARGPKAAEGRAQFAFSHTKERAGSHSRVRVSVQHKSIISRLFFTEGGGKKGADTRFQIDNDERQRCRLDYVRSSVDREQRFGEFRILLSLSLSLSTLFSTIFCSIPTARKSLVKEETISRNNCRKDGTSRRESIESRSTAD